MNEDAINFFLEEIDRQDIDWRDVAEKFGIVRQQYEHVLEEPEVDEDEKAKAARLKEAVQDAVDSVSSSSELFRGAIRNIIHHAIVNNQSYSANIKAISLQPVLLSPKSKVKLARAIVDVAIEQAGHREQMVQQDCLSAVVAKKIAVLVGYEVEHLLGDEGE